MESHKDGEKLKNVDILSFDGGGSRGIMEVSILSDVMRLATIILKDPAKLSFLLGDEDVFQSTQVREKLIKELSAVSSPLHPNEVYDMIVGTSTGGLIAFGLVGGNSDKDGKRLPMTVEECIQMYKDKTKKIFAKSWTQWSLSAIPGLGSIGITNYSQNNVKKVLLEQFRDCCLDDFRDSETIAGAVARQIGQKDELVLFDTYTEAYKHYKTYQVLLATSNAPVYFDTPVKIGNKEFVDGGVGGNCPLGQVIPRAKEIFGDRVKITSALSIAPPPPEDSHIPHGFQTRYWLNYFIGMATNGDAVYLDAKKSNEGTIFRRLAPRGESLKQFTLDEIDAEKMLNAMEDEKLNNGMFLVDVIATATVVLDSYLGKTSDRPEMTVEMGAKLAYMAGMTYASQSELDLAFDSYNTSKRLWKKMGKSDEKTKDAIIQVYQDKANRLIRKGEYQDAIKSFEKLIDYWQKQSNNANIAKEWFCMAECWLLSSQYKKAQEEFESVLELQRRLFEDDNPDIARTLNRIAFCHHAQGNYNMAIETHIAVLEIRRKLYPEGDHLDIAESLNSVGLTFQELGQNEKAVKYVQCSLGMRKRLISESDPIIAESLNNLGWCLMENEEYEKAQENLKMALQMKKEFYGNVHHPSIAITLENFAKCLLHVREGNPELALTYVQQALEMKKRCLGDDNNPAIAKSLEIVGLCLEKAGRLEEAIKYLKKSMRMTELFHPTHPRLVRILSCLGQLLLAQGKDDAAEVYLTKAKDIKNRRNQDSESQSSLEQFLAISPMCV